MTTVAAIQMDSFADAQDSIESACFFIEQAAHQGAKLIALPENFATLGLTQEETLVLAEEFQHGPMQQQLAHCAQKLKVWLVGGTLPLQAGNNKIFSSCLVWDDSGSCVGRYDKIHLFDVKLEKEEEYRESAFVAPGNQIVVLETPVGKCGIAICYDLRFPELFRAFALKGAQVVVVPCAFTIPTGLAHWETLLKARAIENLCYIIAPNEVGTRANGIGTYGHSMIIGPWGDILASQKEEIGVLTAEIDLKSLHRIRQQFPVLTHYRSAVFRALMEK